MADTQIALFKYNNSQIRSILIKNEPWFVAKDICDVLKYSNSRKAISDHCFEDDVTNGYTIKDSLGRDQKNQLQVNISSEPIYRTRQEFIELLYVKIKESHKRQIQISEKALKNFESEKLDLISINTSSEFKLLNNL